MQIRIDTRYAAFCLFLLLPACDKPLSHDQDCASSIKDNSPGEIDQIIYLPGLKDQYRPASIRSFDKTHVLVTGPEDLTLNKYGLIEWTPSHISRSIQELLAGAGLFPQDSVGWFLFVI